MHFHTTADLVIRQHISRGILDPLAVFVFGSGSAAYRKPFEDTNRFSRIISVIETELAQRAAHPVRVTDVDVSSFSAGYGSVRELMRLPSAMKMIRRIVLLDSLYGGLAAQPAATNRMPLAEHIDVWMPFARAAVRGEKTFVITTSDVPTPTYASTRECAEAIVKRLGLEYSPVSMSQQDGTSSFALQARADAGRFHVWSYSGTNGPAHMAHVRNMASFIGATRP